MNSLYRNIFFIVSVVIIMGAAVFAFNKKESSPELTYSTPASQETWKTHESQSLGFTVDYPADMQVVEGPGSGLSEGTVRFLLLGPTQTDGTEVFDGIIFDINKRTYTDTLRNMVEADVKQAHELGEVTQEIKDIEISGKPAYTFKANTLGHYTNIYVDLGNKETIVITYINPDPTDKGFKEMTDRMVASFRVL